MEENLGSNFVGGKEVHSWGHNGEDMEQEWAYARTLLGWLGGRTYRTIHTYRPGSTGKGSCGRFPGEADYQCLGLPRDAEGSTAWHRQGKAAEDQDSNRRPVGDNMPSEVHSRPRASTPVPAEQTALGAEFRTRGTGGRY